MGFFVSGAINMTKIPYNKSHYTYAQQRQKLRDRGMILDIPDNQAEAYLAHFNYYRLSGYWYEYRLPNNQFKPKTCFSNIISLYKFDKELRILLLDAIEQIEISVRTKLAYHLSALYGSHAHLDSTHFKNQGIYQRTLKKLNEEVHRSNEIFIDHLVNTYQETLPPIWASVEVMSLGQLSNWYGNIKLRQDAQLIAKEYQLDSSTLKTFLHHLTVLRNHCAHHARVWNKIFTVTIQQPKSKPSEVVTAYQIDKFKQKRIYNTLVMMAWMLNIIQPDHDWTHRLQSLLQQYPEVNTEKMGFPADWKNYDIWQT